MKRMEKRLTNQDLARIEAWLRRSAKAKKENCPFQGGCEWKCLIIFPGMDEYARITFLDKRLICPCTIYGLEYVEEQVRRFLEEGRNVSDG